jgi:hypothetical protein
MRHIYGLKCPYYDVNKNKIDIKTPHILLGLNGQDGSNNVNPPLVSCVVFQPLFIPFDVKL